MIAHDSIRCDSPSALRELELLNTVKIGDTRSAPLFPAFDTELVWVCVNVDTTSWEFEGRFCGQPLCRLVMRVQAGLLTLDVKEPQ